MKTIGIILGIAFLIISGVMLSLLNKGGALKPAGVIKPAEIGSDPSVIGKQVAIRLFPDFDAAKYVVWYLEPGAEELAQIPYAAVAEYHGPVKPKLEDLRTGTEGSCEENCWYIQELNKELPESIAQKTKSAPTAEIFVQYFDRDIKVPEACDAEKILDVECMKPISVREVHRKLKTPAPHYFMQRYLKSDFYLFIEKPRQG